MIYLILGILFIDICLPILEAFCGCICTRCEQYKAKCAVEINRYNAMTEIAMQPQANRIGFETNFEEEFDD